MIKKVLATALALAAMGWTSVHASLIIAVDQKGANGFVDINHPRVWNFGITSLGAAYFSANGLTFDSALFEAKDHKNTNEPLVFTLYSGLGGNVNGNVALTTVSVPSLEFDQQYSGEEGRLFSFIPQTLEMGYYSVTLTTTAPDNSTQNYFLKQGMLTLLDSNQAPLDVSYWLQDLGTGNAGSTFNGSGSLGGGSLTMVPEPNAAWAMAILCALGVSGSLLQSFRKKLLPA